MTYIGLNTAEHERTAPTGGSPLPAGIYTGVVTRTQLKDTKNKDGNYLEVEFDITTPEEYSNRKFWDRFNILNKSPEATRIGKEQLADLAKSAGLQTLSEDTELHGKEVVLVLKVRPAKDNFQASNECQKYWPLGTTLEQHNAWMKSGSKNAAASTAPSGAQKPAWGSKAAKAEDPPFDADEAVQPVAKAAKPWQKKG